MRGISGSLLSLVLCAGVVGADTTRGAQLFGEIDLTPDVTPCQPLRVSNTTLTANSDGSCDVTTLASLTLTGDVTGTGTGSVATTVAADAVALTTDTTGNYAAGDAEAGNATGVACTDCVALTTETSGSYVTAVTTSVLTGLTGGNTAAEGTTSALAFDYSQALSGNAALGANACVFGVTGLVCEGATADTIELYLAVPDPVSTDKTLTLPNATDTLVGQATTDTLTNKTMAAASNVLDADTAVALAANGANCSAGQYPLGVDAAGAVESCTAGAAATVGDRVHRTAGNVSTTSTSLVDFTGASITLTTGANPVLVGFASMCENGNLSGDTVFNVDVDGSIVMGTQGLDFSEAVVSEALNCSFSLMTADLTAASHTIKLQWMVGQAGTSLTHCDTNYSCNYWVTEVAD